MSGIPIHSSDPISEAKASTTSSQGITSSNASQYPAAAPGQNVPQPTKTVPLKDAAPPAPRPGDVPRPAPPAVTARATLPPPPKAGESITYAGIHAGQPSTATTQTTPAQPSTITTAQRDPVQFSQPTVDTPSRGVPQGSATSISTQPSFQTPANLPPLHQSAAETSGNLQHPPGYVQNQHATDMTAEQRLAKEQESSGQNRSQDPLLGYPAGRSRASSNASATAAGVWEGAKVLAGQVGQKAGAIHGDIWNRLNK